MFGSQGRRVLELDGPRGPEDGSKRGPRQGGPTDISSPRPPEAPRRPQEAPRRRPRGPRRPKRGTQEAQKRPQNGPQEASKLLPRSPREAHHEIPTNTQKASDPQPRHGDGMEPKAIRYNNDLNHSRRYGCGVKYITVASIICTRGTSRSWLWLWLFLYLSRHGTKQIGMVMVMFLVMVIRHRAPWHDEACYNAKCCLVGLL